jgi:hypothetical protein
MFHYLGAMLCLNLSIFSSGKKCQCLSIVICLIGKSLFYVIKREEVLCYLLIAINDNELSSALT